MQVKTEEYHFRTRAGSLETKHHQRQWIANMQSELGTNELLNIQFMIRCTLDQCNKRPDRTRHINFFCFQKPQGTKLKQIEARHGCASLDLGRSLDDFRSSSRETMLRFSVQLNTIEGASGPVCSLRSQGQRERILVGVFLFTALGC